MPPQRNLNSPDISGLMPTQEYSEVADDPTRGPAESTADEVLPSSADPRELIQTDMEIVPPVPNSVGATAFSAELAEPTDSVSGDVGLVPGYEIKGELGRGGMGVVYRAVQTGLKRTVALKMVLADRSSSRKGIIRFLAEAEAMASISHPNVAQVYEYGDANGQPYLALEFLPGGSLADRLAGGYRPEPEDAAKVVAKIARGVAAAHERGIIHRDLKPHNVLFDAHDEPKVTDFGLAKLAVSQYDVTQTNAVVGTPAYMAPEQARGQAKFAGPEADVWALGVILYECLTGRRPFDSNDPFGILIQVTSADPDSPRKYNPRTPRDLELILKRAMAREPADRYPTAKELAEDFDRFIAGEPVTVHQPGLVERTARWAKRKPAAATAWALAIVTVALAGFGGSVAALWMKAEGAFQAEKLAKSELQAEKAKVDELYASEQKAKELAVSARQAAEASADRERLALAELKLVKDANTMGLALREYQSNDVKKARVLLDEYTSATPSRGWEWKYLNRVLNGEAVLLGPAAGPATAASFTAQGKRLVSAHADGVARIWDAATGRLVHELQPESADGKPAEVRDVAASPDGERIVTAGADGMIRVWDARSWQQIAAIPPTPSEAGKAGPVNAVAFDPDGKSFAAGGADGLLRVWDADSFQEKMSVPADVGEVYSVKYSPDGVLLAVGGSNGGAKVWEGDGKEPGWVIPPLKQPVSAVAVTNDGRLAVADAGGAVRIWKLNTGKQIAGFQAHKGRATAMAFSVSGAQLATTGEDRLIRLWDGNNGNRLLGLRGHTDAAWGVGFDPTGKRLVSAGLDGTIRVWDLARPPEGWLIPADTAQVNDLSVSRDGSLLAVATGDSRVKVFSLTDDGPKKVESSGNKSRSLPTPAPPDKSLGQLAVRFADEGGGMVSVTDKGELVRWVPEGGDWKIGDKLAPFGADLASLTAAAFSPNGKLIAVGTESGEVAILDAVKGEVVATLPVAHEKRVGAVAFSPDGMYLASAGWDGVAKLWDAADRREIATLRGHDAEVLAVGFSPDGTVLATTSADHTARLWDAKTGAPLKSLKGHMHWVRSVGFSPDGHRAVTAGMDGSVKIWDITTGLELLNLDTQIDGVTGVTFSPDGSQLFAGGADGLVRVYDATPLNTTAGN